MSYIPPKPPERADFSDQESYEEALDYYRSRIGLLIAEGEAALAKQREFAQMHPNLPPGPKREDYQDEEAYEEAKGYWGSHIGKLSKMAGVRRKEPNK